MDFLLSCLFYHHVVLPAALSSCSPLRLRVRSKLMFKREFENACGAHIEATTNNISVYYLVHLRYMWFILGAKETVKQRSSVYLLN